MSKIVAAHTTLNTDDYYYYMPMLRLHLLKIYFYGYIQVTIFTIFEATWLNQHYFFLRLYTGHYFHNFNFWTTDTYVQSWNQNFSQAKI